MSDFTANRKRLASPVLASPRHGCASRGPAFSPGPRGYTLIELVVTVSVLGFLSVLAYSSFTQYIIKANRSAAEQFMLDIASRQADYLIDARTYANSIGAGGLNLSTPSNVSSNYSFAITLTAGPPAGFLITATPIGRQAQDGALTLDDTGQKLPNGKW